MANSLVETLTLLSHGRKELLQTYTEKNSERYRYSFQYYHSPAALSIASSLLDHQWIDKQIKYALDLYSDSIISKSALELYLKVIKKLSVFKNEEVFVGYEELLRTKILGLQTILYGNDKIDRNLRDIEFDYYRDKVLFEREMEKYSRECEG